LKHAGFDKIAWAYDFLAFIVFGCSQKRAQVHFMNSIPKGANILMMGGGSGWLLKKIIELNRAEHITYVDTSSKMLALARERVKGNSVKVEFILGDETSISSHRCYDVIITGFFLDLFTQSRVSQILGLIYNTLRVGGIWLQTDFALEKIQDNPAKIFLIRLMYLFFYLICGIEARKLPDLNSEFAALDMMEENKKYFYDNMIKTSLYKKF
jgi:ubiquinone/menaquinone biosynthesis C-methylase UbiE